MKTTLFGIFVELDTESFNLKKNSLIVYSIVYLDQFRSSLYGK